MPSLRSAADANLAAMCLVLAAVRVVPGHPLVLVANRDEFHDRPAQAPRERGGDPRVWCGIDLRAGGTWLGVNAAGVVAALTNRPGAQEPARASRGGVPLAALSARTAEEGARRAADLAVTLGPNPFSLLVADGAGAWFVAHPGGTAAPLVRALAPGLHTTTNTHDVDGLPAATVLAAEGFAPDALHRATSLDEAAAILGRVARSHAPLDGTRTAACVHGQGRGTVSSALIAVAEDGSLDYRHAQGAPCTAPFVGVTLG
jgi:uncharacterized protein with NRDE domain